MRNVMLEGKLRVEDCNEENACEFLKLVAVGKNHEVKPFKQIEHDEWVKVVKKAKGKVHCQFFQTELTLHVNVHYILS